MSCVFRQPSAIVAVGRVQNVTKFRVRASHNVVSCNRQRLECMRVAAGGKRLLFITFSLRVCVCVPASVCLVFSAGVFGRHLYLLPRRFELRGPRRRRVAV